MDKRNVLIGLLLFAVLSASMGYTFAQIALQRKLTGSVTVRSQPDLYLLAEDGKPALSLEFGELSNGETVNRTVRAWNAGNSILLVTFNRTDGNVAKILHAFLKQDGTPFDGQPVALSPGQGFYVVIELGCVSNAQAGSYSLEFTFYGEEG